LKVKYSDVTYLKLQITFIKMVEVFSVVCMISIV